MSKRTTYHVTKRPDGRWQTKATAASRAAAVADNKAEVVDRARGLAKAQPPGQATRTTGHSQSQRSNPDRAHIRQRPLSAEGLSAQGLVTVR